MENSCVLALTFHGATVVKWKVGFGYRKNAGPCRKPCKRDRVFLPGPFA